MSEFMQKPKRKARTKGAAASQVEIEFNVGETFSPSKEADFSLNLKEMQYQAKAGQAGTRCQATNYDGRGSGEDPNATRAQS